MMSAAGPKNHVPELQGVPVAEQIQALTELPTVVDNDVNALALGERAFGLGRGAASLVVLAIGTEIGGAFVAGDMLLRGAHAFAGEFGHLPVNFNGPRCFCGGRGCLGVYLGGRQLAEEARRRLLDGAPSMLVDRAGGDADAITASMVFAAAADGDPLAAALVDDACQALAATLAIIVNGLDPEVIVITGGVAESLAPLHADVLRRTAGYAYAHPLGSTRIQITRSTKRDTVRGGAALFAYERARRAGGR
jgi:glucokinase